MKLLTKSQTLYKSPLLTRFLFSTIKQLNYRMLTHYNDVIMGAMTSQITSLTIVYSTVYLGADQRKHQSSASLAFVRGNHQWRVNSSHKWPVTRKMFSFDDVNTESPIERPCIPYGQQLFVIACFHRFCLWYTIRDHSATHNVYCYVMPLFGTTGICAFFGVSFKELLETKFEMTLRMLFINLSLTWVTLFYE